MPTIRAPRGSRTRRATAVALVGGLTVGGVAVGLASPVSAASSTIKVTSAADTGSGTLRDALERASADPGIRRITVKNGLGAIAPANPLAFTGGQPLTVDGGGATIDGSGLAALEDVLTLDGPDITVRSLTVTGGPDDGIVVPHARSVSIAGVTAAHNGAQGVLVDDGGAAHGVDLDVRQSTFDANGVDVCDTDGMRVNETGEGSLVATFVGVVATGNEHDGIELDERGAGDARATMRNSTFTDNGVNDCVPFDQEDGFDVDELDDGNVVVDIANSTFTGNAEEGLDLDEGDDELGPEQQNGDLFVALRNVDASNNGAGAEEDDIDIDEVGAGDYTVLMTNVTSDGAFKDGYDGSEQGEGDLTVALVNSSFSGSTDGRGIDLAEDGDGNFIVLTRNVAVDGNHSDGFRGEEADGGNLAVGLTASSFTGNGDDSIQLDQGDAGQGLLALRNTAYDDLNLSSDIVVRGN